MRLEGHKSLVNDISINPTGTYLVSASSDHTVKLWDLIKYSINSSLLSLFLKLLKAKFKIQ